MRKAQAEGFGNYSDDEEDENKILDNLFEETKEKPAAPEGTPATEAAAAGDGDGEEEKKTTSQEEAQVASAE